MHLLSTLEHCTYKRSLKGSFEGSSIGLRPGGQSIRTTWAQRLVGVESMSQALQQTAEMALPFDVGSNLLPQVQESGSFRALRYSCSRFKGYFFVAAEACPSPAPAACTSPPRHASSSPRGGFWILRTRQVYDLVGLEHGGKYEGQF